MKRDMYEKFESSVDILVVPLLHPRQRRERARTHLLQEPITAKVLDGM